MKKLLITISLFTATLNLISQPSINGRYLNQFILMPKVIEIRPNNDFFTDVGKFSSNFDTLFKYNLWAPLRLQTIPGYQILQVKSDGNGGCVVAGEVAGTLAHNGDSLKPYSNSNNSLYDIFIIHFNADGSRKWWYRISDSWSQYPTNFFNEKSIDICIKNNKIYWLVEFGHNAPIYHLGNHTEYIRSFSNQNRSFIVLSFNNDGSVNWAFEPFEAKISFPKHFSANNSGEVAVLVTSKDKISLSSDGSKSITNADRLSVFKLNENGKPLWITAISNDMNNSKYRSCQIDNNGNVYTCQSSTGNFILGINTDHDYIVKLSSSGNIDWHRKYKGSLFNAFLINNKLLISGSCASDDRYLQTGATDSINIKRDEANATAEFFAEFDESGNKTWHLIGKKTGIIKNTTMLGFENSGKFDDESGAYFVASFTGEANYGSFSFPSSLTYTIGYLTLNYGGTQTSVMKTSNHLNEFTVYPNPNNGSFVILANKPGNYAIADINGKLITEFNLNTTYEYVNLNLSKGIYILIDKNSGAIKKFVIE